MARAEQRSFSVQGGKVDISNWMSLFNTEECKLRYCLIQGKEKEEKSVIIIFAQENIPPRPR